MLRTVPSEGLNIIRIGTAFISKSSCYTPVQLKDGTYRILFSDTSLEEGRVFSSVKPSVNEAIEHAEWMPRVLSLKKNQMRIHIVIGDNPRVATIHTDLFLEDGRCLDGIGAP